MRRERLELALEQLAPAQWERFEQFASEFLVSDFPNLRTVASPSGDEGRDAELFGPQGDPGVVLQYSVTKDWAGKINKTAARIQSTLPKAKYLIYVTNQSVGAAADKLRETIRKTRGIYVDIRDRSWFLERRSGDPGHEAASEALARDVVDPFLAENKIIEGKATALNSIELRAGFLFLNLQLEDDIREKGLTKLAFEALVRSVLRNSHSDARLSRARIHAAICTMFAPESHAAVKQYVDAALVRLNKRYVRHWEKQDEYCLTHDESQRVKDRLESYEVLDQSFRNEIAVITKDIGGVYQNPGLVSDEINLRIRRVLEKFLHGRAELFASSLKTGQMHHLELKELRDIAISDLSEFPPAEPSPHITDVVAASVHRLIYAPPPAVQEYLKSLSDSYTLLSFLRQTPDVQSAIKKMFSAGEIWVDTSVVLPLFAEILVPEENRRFTRMFRASREAGLSLKISDGVIEELERHMNRSATCANMSGTHWKGTVPFLFAFYVQTGRSNFSFSDWLETFRGTARPQDDIAEYLDKEFAISRADIGPDYESADPTLRNAVFEVWHDIHTKRRKKWNSDFDPALTHRLAQHDAESFAGVVVRRKEEKPSPFGYSAWWLTLDGMAFQVNDRLAQRVPLIPPSPVMSPDFLINYLSLGPARGRIKKESEEGMPVSLDLSFVDYLTPELLRVAEQARESAKDMPEHVIRRRVRDALDDARRRAGPVLAKGLSAMIEEITEI